MASVVVVGGGFAGCAAAAAAARAGARVHLLERTDMLLAGGIRAGRMNYNGKLVAAEEAKALGAGDIFLALEGIILHRGNILEEQHAYIYNTALAEPVVRKALEELEIQLVMETRAVEVRQDGPTIQAVRVDAGDWVSGDAFIDCTGGSGGMAVCHKYGKGCAMCIYLRCPVYGDRVSIATRAGAPELARRRPDGTPGAIGSAITIYKETIDRDLLEQLETKGAVSIPLPAAMVDYHKQAIIGGIRTRKQMENINMVDIGAAIKCVGLGYLTLSQLRSIPGLANAQIEDPMGGGRYNKVSKVSMAPRDNAMLVTAFTNLLCAGEKAGPGTGIAEVLATGIVAGHNAARIAAGKEPLEIPSSLAIGDFIDYTGQMMQSEAGLQAGYSMGHGIYWERMLERDLYTSDPTIIQDRVKDAGWDGALAKTIC